MKKKLISIGSLIIVLLLGCRVFASEAIFHDGRVHLTEKTKDGKQIDVRARIATYTDQNPYKKGFRWGVELKKPREILVDISLIIDKEELFVPISAYSDLANPRKIALLTEDKVIKISIFGGDAATSYKADLIFQNGYIQRRKVTHQEFPDVAWEETIYSFNKLE